MRGRVAGRKSGETGRAGGVGAGAGTAGEASFLDVLSSCRDAPADEAGCASTSVVWCAVVVVEVDASTGVVPGPGTINCVPP